MLSGTKLEYTRRYNRRIIIEAIRVNGPISRAEISRMTGLTTATVSTLTSELLTQAIILETGRRKGLRGQPAIELELNPEGRFSIGFELGRSHLSGVAINLAGTIMAEVHEDWDYPPPDAALSQIAGNVTRLLEETHLPEERLLGVGVAMPGPFVTDDKQVVFPINFPTWEQFPIGEKLTETLGLPVILENDAMAAALGEHFHGQGRSFQDFYYLYLGAGIGGAIILNGHPYQGFSPNTGELGRMRHHTKGPRAFIGSFLGLPHFYRFLQHYGLPVSDRDGLEHLFNQQDPHLWEWFNEAVDCLDIIIHSVNAIVGPEAIFFGGRFPKKIIEHLLLRLQLEGKATRASQPDKHIMYEARLLQATFGELASALGAATLPLYETFSAQPGLLQQKKLN